MLRGIRQDLFPSVPITLRLGSQRFWIRTTPARRSLHEARLANSRAVLQREVDLAARVNLASAFSAPVSGRLSHEHLPASFNNMSETGGTDAIGRAWGSKQATENAEHVGGNLCAGFLPELSPLMSPRGRDGGHTAGVKLVTRASALI
jgi:hypothetical protein